MIYDNVNLWFAKDLHNNIITIDEVDENNKKEYYCPLCGSELIPKATKSKLITSHFAHVDASKCTGESYVHFWFKNKFLVHGDKFSVVSDQERQYVCKEILVEQSYSVGDRLYRPDVTVLTECGNTIYFEMDYSNKKKLHDYIDIWLELKNIVVEVDIKKLMSKDKIPTFKALFYDGKCFNVKKNDTYYNTIGKYKEKLHKQLKTSDKLKDMIQKLDWFWEEVINYKKDKIDIETLVDFVDYNEPEEKSLILEILSTKRCTSMFENYVNHKIDIFEKLAIDLIDGNDTFYLEKTKIGRKYKNIKYNTVVVKCKYFIDRELKLNVVDFTKEMLISNINNFISSTIKLKQYFDRAKEIHMIIEDKCKYISDVDGLKLYIRNNIYSSSYLFEISLNAWYTNRFSVFVHKNCIKYNGNIIDVDILNYNNESLIINFIMNSIFEEIQKYNTYEINRIKVKLEKEIEAQKNKRDKEEKLLQRIQDDKDKFKSIIDNISKILDCNNDKIIVYNNNFTLYDMSNLLYFKDYRGKEFIVHGGGNHLHYKNYPKFSHYFDGFINHEINFNTINTDNILGNDIYIFETDNSYKIDCYPPTVFYNFPKIFNNSINVSFRNIDSNIISLPRYNFVEATSKLKKLLSKLSSLKYDYLDNYLEENKNIIHQSSLSFTDESINNDIYKILYPVVYLSEKYSSQDNINIKLNVDFTIENGKRQPWLVKDFIKVLEEICIYNVKNII